MAGTILENLSGKKLSILVGTLLVCQLVCFLIGGFLGMYTEWCLYGENILIYYNCAVLLLWCSSGTGECSKYTWHGLQRCSGFIQWYIEMGLFSRNWKMWIYPSNWLRKTWYSTSKSNCICISGTKFFDTKSFHL